ARWSSGGPGSPRPQRADNVDVGGRPPHHAQGLLPHRQHGVAAGVHRAHAGLVEDHPLFAGGDDDGAGAQINADFILFHGSFSWAGWAGRGWGDGGGPAPTLTANTLTAPACSSASAQAETVAPVVITSSTSSTRIPLRSVPGRQA